MARIFVSFLGTGNPKMLVGYSRVTYAIGNDRIQTEFAQRAILEHHDAASFDRVHLLMTPESKGKHRDLLHAELLSIGVRPEAMQEDASITTSMDAEDQWRWFESLLKVIDNGDEVIFDFTHGFRSVPIIFSTAIGFLQKARRFTLRHVYYGYKHDQSDTGEIVDMARFYRINDWAEGVARLTETADASKLAILAAEEGDGGFAALNDPELIEALKSLTDIIKNIDVNHVAVMADKALNIVRRKQDQCSGADRQLLHMVQDKFGDLASQAPPSGLYDEPYFRTQLILSAMLLKHHLPMQAFTVMRECVASIGMLGVTSKPAGKAMTSKDGRDNRKRFGELFVTMCQFPRDTWNYWKPEENHVSERVMEDFHLLLPFYNALEELGLAALLQRFVRPMVDLRNGFDHAWTAKGQGVPASVRDSGRAYLKALSQVIDMLVEHGHVPRGAA